MSRRWRCVPFLLLGTALTALASACSPDQPEIAHRLDVGGNRPHGPVVPAFGTAPMSLGHEICGEVYNIAAQDLREAAAVVATGGRAADKLRAAEAGFTQFLSIPACASFGGAAHAATVTVVWLAFFQGEYGRVVILAAAAADESLRDLREVLLACPGETAALRELRAAHLSDLAHMGGAAQIHFQFAMASTNCITLQQYVVGQTAIQI